MCWDGPGECGSASSDMYAHLNEDVEGRERARARARRSNVPRSDFIKPVNK